MALALAPLTEWANSQFFLPTTNDRIAFSARLLSTGIWPSSRQRYRYGFSLRQYCTALASLVPPLMGSSFSYAKRPSRIGFNRSCRWFCLSFCVRGSFTCAPRSSLPSSSRSRIKISLQSSTPFAAALSASKAVSVGNASTNFLRA